MVFILMDVPDCSCLLILKFITTVHYFVLIIVFPVLTLKCPMLDKFVIGILEKLAQYVFIETSEVTEVP